MKISIFECKGWEKDYLAKRLRGHSLSFSEEPLSLKNAATAKGAEALVVFIYSRLDAPLLAKFPKLKLIATRSTGFDHVALAACRKHGIVVCNVPHYGENTVAEHTFALILALSRNVHKSYLRTLRNDFSIEGLKGFDLQGRTIGVVGAGSIGLHVVRIAKGFGMNVLCHDPHQDRMLAEVMGFRYVSFDELLSESDIVSLHIPFSKETHHLIDAAAIRKMKKGAILINTARGGLVDTEALIEGLDKKILSGVGLDVLEGEEFIKEEKQLLYDPKKAVALESLVKDHILLARDEVVFTPHIAFYSQEALERILDTTVQNIAAFSEGKPQNIVR